MGEGATIFLITAKQTEFNTVEQSQSLNLPTK